MLIHKYFSQLTMIEEIWHRIPLLLEWSPLHSFKKYSFTQRTEQIIFYYVNRSSMCEEKHIGKTLTRVGYVNT